LSTTVATVGGAGFLVLVVLSLLVFGVRGGSSDSEEPPDVTTTMVERQEAPQVESPPIRGVDLVIDPRIEPERFHTTTPALGDLPDESTAVVVIASGDALVLQQCVTRTGHHRRECGPGVPAGSFGARAAGLVELRRVLQLESGTYDCSLQPCELVASIAGTPKVVASAVLVFGEPAKAPTLEVRPSREVRPGQILDVRVRALAPRERVRVTWCVPPGPVEPSACGSPAPGVSLRADESGVARGRLAVPERDAGPGDARCGPRSPCAVAIVGTTLSGAPVEVAFAGVPGPDLPARRLVTGISIAALLGLIAWWLVRRRADEVVADPFWGVSIDVPEWEGIDVTAELEEV
jgi:hypothetical protein